MLDYAEALVFRGPPAHMRPPLAGASRFYWSWWTRLDLGTLIEDTSAVLLLSFTRVNFFIYGQNGADPQAQQKDTFMTISRSHQEQSDMAVNKTSLLQVFLEESHQVHGKVL